MHYVYIYYDPARGHSPFYVGKGKTIYVVYRHLNGQSHSRTVSSRIAGIRKQGYEAKIGLICCVDNTAASKLEKELIAQIGRRNLNLGPLLNLTDGGDGEVGRVVSQETKNKISLTLTGGTSPKPKGFGDRIKARLKIFNPSSGRILSDETKAKMSSAHTGVKRPQFAKLMKGRPKSQHMRDALSIAKTGVPRGKLTCPYCDKTGGDGNMHRWHFDKCKSKT